MSSRERLRAALKEPSRHPSSPSFLPSSLLVLSLSITPSPLHIAQQPFFSGGAPLFHLYTRLSSPPLRQNVCRETRVPSPPPSTGEQPLWHRREPALISHLPLFFISDIRIYHRDPAGTPLEGRGRRAGRGWRRIKGHGGREKGRGRIPLKKDGEAPTIIGRVGLPRSLTIIDPHSPRRREWIQTLSISSIMSSFSICLYLLLLLRDGESCAAVQPWYFIHPSSMDRSIDPSSLLDSCDSNQIEIRRKTLSRSSLLIICITNVDIFIIYCNFQRWSINRTSQCITSFPIIWIK